MFFQTVQLMHSIIQPSLRHRDNDLSNFTIVCSGCGTELPVGALTCPSDNGLPRAMYSSRQLHLHDHPGMGRFREWLPVNGPMNIKAGPITYRSTGLARELGLTNLYIGFNGYWPEMGANILTCSFKELEAYPTIQRMQELGHCKLVLASAGNTARAFAHAAVGSDIQVYIVVPGSGIDRMWIPEEPSDNIHFISMAKTFDYTDAIRLADRIASLPGMTPEGGARNVARRDGMGTVMLDGAVTMGRIPDHYFQAIGSGTGGIAAFEASVRLQADGRFGKRLSILHLAQNLPFAPIFDAWQHGHREIDEAVDVYNTKQLINQMYTDILSNRKPPYSVPGGVYDALSLSNGHVYGIDNSLARSCNSLFEELEDIDIMAPAAVGVAALVEAVELGRVKADDHILLNITGGGVERLKEDFDLCKIQPELHIDSLDVEIAEILP